MQAQVDFSGRIGHAGNMDPGDGPKDDVALVLAIATRRDRAAFGALFSRYAPRLKSWFMRNGTPADRAEDLAQETMLAVWRRADSYDPGRAAVSAWIFTIGRNQSIDALRRLARPLPDADDPSMAPPEPMPPDAALDMAQDETRLRAALRDLPPEQAEVIRLAYYEDRPHVEIERSLGIPLGTVKSRLRLAMARLRTRLTEPANKGGTV
jgi:RNA polymerase sigma-70 factor (ECF subfamily)